MRGIHFQKKKSRVFEVQRCRPILCLNGIIKLQLLNNAYHFSFKLKAKQRHLINALFSRVIISPVCRNINASQSDMCVYVLGIR